ncbi:DUF4158 domain-containing protein [Mycobacterium sp.]|uniref:DUF4158 domain-containing protein n=1 Tax=Mycobacterium sp. TaxID=1785 RepID=UPI003F959021
MPVRYLSDPELARLSSWPDEIAVQDAVTYFTLSTDDLSWLTGFNRQHNRLGVAVQLSTLPWLGWIPDDLAGCPPIALDRLAQALGVAPATALPTWPLPQRVGLDMRPGTRRPVEGGRDQRGSAAQPDPDRSGRGGLRGQLDGIYCPQYGHRFNDGD